MNHPIVLALLASPADRQCLKNIISHSNWELRFAGSLREAKAAVRDPAVGIVISDRHLPSGEGWTDVLAALSTLTIPPAFIVADKSADACVWAELLNLGGYDLIMKPFDPREVVRTVSGAWLSWKQRSEAAVRMRKPLQSSAGRHSDTELLT